jgi:hypothetical protein
LLFGAAAAALVLLFMASGKPAAAQSADAQERCTGDVMRLCSEFVPDADSIVVCLKAKRLELTSSCLNALAPPPVEPVALASPPARKVQKARRPAASVATARSTKTVATARPTKVVAPARSTKIRHPAVAAR